MDEGYGTDGRYGHRQVGGRVGGGRYPLFGLDHIYLLIFVSVPFRSIDFCYRVECCFFENWLAHQFRPASANPDSLLGQYGFHMARRSVPGPFEPRRNVLEGRSKTTTIFSPISLVIPVSPCRNIWSYPNTYVAILGVFFWSQFQFCEGHGP